MQPWGVGHDAPVTCVKGCGLGLKTVFFLRGTELYLEALTEWHRDTTSYRGETCQGVCAEVPFCGVREHPEVISHCWLPSLDRVRRLILVLVDSMTETFGVVFVVYDSGRRICHLEVIVKARIVVGIVNGRTNRSERE